MNDVEVREFTFKFKGSFARVSSEAVKEVVLNPVVEVVCCDDGSVCGGPGIEIQSGLSAFCFGSESFFPNFTFPFQPQFFT